MDGNAPEFLSLQSMKAAQIYMLTAQLPRINTTRDEQMVELAEYFGVNYRKDFLNLN